VFGDCVNTPTEGFKDIDKLRSPSDKQIKLALSLDINLTGKSFRVLSAEITDALELKSFAVVQAEGIEAGIDVEYIGQRSDMPRFLTINTVGKNGFLFFKGTSKYCRPWNVRVVAD
jgi:hypothetical protein